jgi:hypothetical protein
MKIRTALALGASLLCAPAFAQPQASAPVAAQPVMTAPAVAAVPELRTATISAGLSIPLALTSELSSSRNKEGETFSMVVTNDVLSDGIVVIPRGTRAVGEITLRSSRGMFGKSGKMELSFRYLDMDGVRVPLDGEHFQAGEGNTAGTVGAVLAAGVIGGAVVTGRSANMPTGREFVARTIDPLPLVVRDPAAGSLDRPMARLASTYVPSAIETGSAHRMAEQQPRARAASGRPKETCEQEAQRRTSSPGIQREIEARCRRQRSSNRS